MNEARKRSMRRPVERRSQAGPGPRTWRGAALLFLAGLGGAGCGGNLTAGGFSEVEAYVAGDDAPAAEGAATSASRSVAGPLHQPLAPSPATEGAGAGASGAVPPGATAAPSHPLPAATTIEGTVTVTLRLEVMDDRRVWTEITRGPTTVTVPLVGQGPGALLAAANLPPGRYVRSRITFEEVEADVVRGLQVDGLDLRGRVRVEFEAAAGRMIQEALFLDLRDGDRAQLAVALNSQLWLRLVNAVLRRVPEAGFRQAVRVRVLRGG